jgi:hypothetical protein
MSCRCALDGLGSEQLARRAAGLFFEPRPRDPSGSRQPRLTGSANAPCGPAPDLAGLDRDRVGASVATAEGWRVPLGLYAIRELLCADAQEQPSGDPEGLRPMPERMDAERCLLRGDATALGVYS